jgi:hypothetical protein
LTTAPVTASTRRATPSSTTTTEDAGDRGSSHTGSGSGGSQRDD